MAGDGVGFALQLQCGGHSLVGHSFLLWPHSFLLWPLKVVYMYLGMGHSAS